MLSSVYNIFSGKYFNFELNNYKNWDLKKELLSDM